VNLNRSGPPSLRSRLGAIFPLLGFATYVAVIDYRWFDVDVLPLFLFYSIVAIGTFVIMLSGVFWKSYSHLPPAPGRVIAIIPVYNEDPELYTAAIWSLINQTIPPDVIHVMDDGSRRPLQAFNHPLVRWHSQNNQGKRHAQYNILKMYSPNAWDFIFTVDSDSVCDPDALEHLLRSMSDSAVQAATGMIFVRNWRKNLLTRLTDINVVTSCLMFRMFRSHMGVVTPTSGAIALYRADLVYDNLEDYVTSGTAGDDRRLSFYALLRGKVVGVHESVVETALPETWGGIFNQRLRWSKSAWLGIPFVLTNLRILPVFLYMYPMIFALMWPFVVVVLARLWWVYSNPTIWYGLGFLVVISVCMTAIYSLYRPSMTYRQRLGQWLLSPIYPILGLIILRPAAYMALTKLRSNSWHTREIDSDEPGEGVLVGEILDSNSNKKQSLPSWAYQV
jgi:cellulose synthase/poly-beta-1,6-N-acetylglucosamine synthase-like glycosyltransferase